MAFRLDLKNKRLRQRLTIIFVGACGIALAFAYFSFLTIQIVSFKYRFEDELRSLSRILSSASRAAVGFQDEAAATRLLSAVASRDDIEQALLLRSDGTILAAYPYTDVLSPKSIETGWSWHSYTLSQPVVIDGAPVGSLLMTAKFDSLYFEAAGTLTFTVLLLSVAIGIGWYFSKRLQAIVIAPIEALSSAAKDVARSSDYTVRIPVENEDELGELADSFNHMLYEIETRTKQLVDARGRAEEAAHTKSRFLANMSHELRTPLRAIIGLTNEVLESGIGAEEQKLLTVSRDSGHALLGIIGDILEYAKLENGRMSLNLESIETKKLLDEVLQLFAVEAKKRKISMAASQIGSVPHKVIADSGKIKQVLINLVGNALKFTAAGGRIDLRLLVEQQSDSEAQLKFSIRDTGIGIAPEKVGLLFQPFTQVDNSIARAAEGTGLGLAISGRIVALLGGKLWVESELDLGSVFHFTAKVTPVAVKDSDDIGRSQAAKNVQLLADTIRENSRWETGTMTILVVEDTRVNQLLARRLLEKRGYRVLLAEDGIKALESIKNCPEINIVLMDIQMPLMDGIEATRRIRDLEKNSLHRIPIIAYSASVAEEDKNEALLAGADLFFSKTIDDKKLFEVLEAIRSKSKSVEDEKNKHTLAPVEAISSIESSKKRDVVH